MLSIQYCLVLRWFLVVVWHFVLLMTETTGLNPEENHPMPNDARLADGGSLCSGMLQMKHRGEWRALNIRVEDTWYKVNFAQVACRQMGCGSVVSIAHRTNDTEQKPAWEANFICTGTESTLKECGSTRTDRGVQGKRTSAPRLEVICSEAVRLVGASNVCAGSVEVKSDQGWVSVCKDGFDSEAEKVVCREMGCGPPGNFMGSFSKEEGLVLSKQFHCKGNESRLEDCASTIRNDCRPASGISCSHYGVRLVGGENQCQGSLQGKNYGEWRPLSDIWGFLRIQDLAEICREVGCADVISQSQDYLPISQPVWELSTSCDHAGSSICKAWRESTSRRVFTVTCSEAVRLVKGRSRCSGTLEVKSGQLWISVCNSFFSSEAALVTCRDLKCGFPRGYGSRERDVGRFQNTDPVFKCEGKEKHLMDCPSTMLNATDEELRECRSTHLTCREHPEKPVMYMNVQDPLSDPPKLFKGHRFAIFCGAHSPYKILSFRLKSLSAKHPTVLIQSAVDGEALFIFPAAEDAHQGRYACDYNFDFSSEVFSEVNTIFVTVEEPNDVRLVNRSNRCTGTLEVKYRKEWRPVSYQHSWSLKEAAVLCRQLNCGSAVSTSRVDNSAELLPTWRFYSDCDGSEQALMDCGTVSKWRSASTVEVVCSDIVPPPNISVYSKNEPADDQQQDELIFKGRTFTIKCSVEPRYPGGHFSIIFTGLNQTHSHTQPAVNHAAYFTYIAGDEVKGNYSCVYHNFIFNHNFSTESRSLSVIIHYDADVALDDGVFKEDDSQVCAGKLLVNLEGEFKLLSAESTVWDLRHASLVCRQLGCGSAVSTKEIHLAKKENMAHFFSDCDGSEASLLDCGSVRSWFSSSAVEVTCTGHQGAAGKN